MPTVRYRIEVGREHGVEARNIVGAIANEAGLESRYIGAIRIEADHSTIELPDGMPKEIFQHLKNVHLQSKDRHSRGRPGYRLRAAEAGRHGTNDAKARRGPWARTFGSGSSGSKRSPVRRARNGKKAAGQQSPDALRKWTRSGRPFGGAQATGHTAPFGPEPRESRRSLNAGRLFSLQSNRCDLF